MEEFTVRKTDIIRRILLSNVFIGLVTVPVYIVLKSFPFFAVFGVGVLTTLTVLMLFFTSSVQSLWVLGQYYKNSR